MSKPTMNIDLDTIFLTAPNQDKPVESKKKLVFQKVKRNTSIFLKGLLGIIADLLKGVGVRVGNLYPISSYAMNAF